MKPEDSPQDVLPLARFQSHAHEVLARVRDSGRPLLITQDGRPAAVLLSPEEFERLTEHDRFLRAVAEGLDDAKAGRILDDSMLGEDLDHALGAEERR